jgi:DNA-binding response OmpR family regulator
MSGEALAKAIKKKSPQQIIVMLTGKAEPVDQKQGDRPSIDFTLSKPFHLHELRDVVRKATLKRTAQNTQFNFVCKQDWLSIQRHLPKGGNAEHIHPLETR